MKIRTQFYMLCLGIVVIPILCMGMLYFWLRSSEHRAIEIPGYEEVNKISGGNLDQGEWDKLKEFILHKPPDMDFSIIDKNNVVVFSTIPEHSPGLVLEDAIILDYIRQKANNFVFQIDAPDKESKSNFLVLTKLDRGSIKNRPNPFGKFFSSLVTAFICLFLFSAFMSIVIIRSITMSVMYLDKATKALAQGNLERPIEIGGSNEITSLSASLNSMRLALKENQTRRSRFIMGVSHDLKTPLALIKGYSEAIEDGIADDEQTKTKYLGIICSKVDQLEEMIDDLIDFIKIDTVEWRRQLEKKPLASFLEKIFKRIQSDAIILKRNAKYSVDIGNVLVPFDERLVSRAIENIANNSLRYTKEGGNINLCAYLEKDNDGKKTITISMSDDGIGINNNDINKIFDLFYRGSSSRQEAGMGLGLAVVKDVVESHAWTINVKNNLKSGCAFKIVIPSDCIDSPM